MPTYHFIATFEFETEVSVQAESEEEAFKLVEHTHGELYDPKDANFSYAYLTEVEED